MHSLLNFAETAYIQSQNLKPLLRDYTNPDDLLSRLVKSKELIRLKNGFFLIPENIKGTVPFEQIANLLYGPSYISYEWALSYYGMIPEGVFVVTSATIKRTRSYKTPVGTFDYHNLNHARYSIGIDQKENAQGRFLVATPEKALADLIHKKSKGLNGKDLLVDLLEARRMEKSDLMNLDKKLLAEINERYKSKTIHSLVKVIGAL